MLRAALVVLACSFVPAPREAAACAAAPPEGASVQIAEEEALILWDPATRTEHFIRSAEFHSSARAFGFLVPTPTVPELGEVEERVFTVLADNLRRPVEYETSGRRFQVRSVLAEGCLAKGVDKSGGEAPPSAVREISSAYVSGMRAITVEADDPAALAGWLQEHGFARTPQLTEWLAVYVAQKWKITAFVVEAKTHEADGGSEPGPVDVRTTAVRMSFKTDRPFYPYREPVAAEPSTAPRTLRVHFLSTERYAATLAGAPWSAPVELAAAVDPLVPISGLGALAHGLPFATVFIDRSAPRRGIDEVYFAPSADRSIVRPAAFIIASPDDIVIPIELLVVAAVGVLVVVRRSVRRRRRRALGTITAPPEPPPR